MAPRATPTTRDAERQHDEHLANEPRLRASPFGPVGGANPDRYRDGRAHLREARLRPRHLQQARWRRARGQRASITTRRSFPSFSTLDGYLNYTIRNHSMFDQTKIRLSGNESAGRAQRSKHLTGRIAESIYLNGGRNVYHLNRSNPCDPFSHRWTNAHQRAGHAQPDGRPQLLGFGDLRVCAQETKK